jgi:hypothetical protein
MRRAHLGLARIRIKQRGRIRLAKWFRSVARVSHESHRIVIQRISRAIDGPEGTSTRQKLNRRKKEKHVFKRSSVYFRACPVVRLHLDPRRKLRWIRTNLASLFLLLLFSIITLSNAYCNARAMRSRKFIPGMIARSRFVLEYFNSVESKRVSFYTTRLQAAVQVENGNRAR